jgi:hypothetical protein
MRLCLGVMRAGIGAWRGREECKNAPPHHMQHPAATLTPKLPNVSGEGLHSLRRSGMTRLEVDFAHFADC